MSLLEQALSFAAAAHEGMTRKGSQTPFLLHPMETAVIVSSLSSDPEVLAAALLHDVVEDTSCTLEELEERFGSRVASLVAEE
ncbi:MAG: bifunctional (p)ppGpp synthetase/guanosine-3',5'-bis(diphosphate) 3'-pyrophosphohydrolase, partial [Oscillospiraceae bacterium]|nr:bifunctional (p)ppGpp synthetase/guanosine-3',5'-bis(diphosphate) 3'-pyrophosphohydrolase [Oscillospiraceae bacterium]